MSRHAFGSPTAEALLGPRRGLLVYEVPRKA